jgi:hypothetical protein
VKPVILALLFLACGLPLAPLQNLAQQDKPDNRVFSGNVVVNIQRNAAPGK